MVCTTSTFVRPAFTKHSSIMPEWFTRDLVGTISSVPILVLKSHQQLAALLILPHLWTWYVKRKFVTLLNHLFILTFFNSTGENEQRLRLLKSGARMEKNYAATPTLVLIVTQTLRHEYTAQMTRTFGPTRHAPSAQRLTTMATLR